MTVYVCAKCRFAFERKGEVERCEDCGHVNVRYATDKEVAEYLRNREETHPPIASERVSSALSE